MILLDENIPEDQRQLLRGWRVRVHQIGEELGHVIRVNHLGVEILSAHEPAEFHPW